MNDGEIKNTIEFWEKHQELDKFNFQLNLAFFTSSIAMIVSAFIGLLAIVVSSPIDSSDKILTISTLCILTLLVIEKRRRIHKRHGENKQRSFRIREAMLRFLYNNLKVDKVNTEDRKSVV